MLLKALDLVFLFCAASFPALCFESILNCLVDYFKDQLVSEALPVKSHQIAMPKVKVTRPCVAIGFSRTGRG